MNDLKREAEETAKEAWRRADGTTDLDDKVANLGDDVRKPVGNAGDKGQENVDSLGDKVAEVVHDTRKTADKVGDDVRREVDELGDELSDMDEPGDR